MPQALMLTIFGFGWYELGKATKDWRDFALAGLCASGALYICGMEVGY